MNAYVRPLLLALCILATPAIAAKDCPAVVTDSRYATTSTPAGNAHFCLADGKPVRALDDARAAVTDCAIIADAVSPHGDAACPWYALFSQGDRFEVREVNGALVLDVTTGNAAEGTSYRRVRGETLSPVMFDGQIVGLTAHVSLAQATGDPLQQGIAEYYLFLVDSASAASNIEKRYWLDAYARGTGTCDAFLPARTLRRTSVAMDCGAPEKQTGTSTGGEPPVKAP